MNYPTGVFQVICSSSERSLALDKPYLIPFRGKMRKIKLKSDKCRIYKNPPGQMQNLKELVGNSDKCMRPGKTIHFKASFNVQFNTNCAVLNKK